MLEELTKQLERDEGYRQFVYECPAGKLTVGVGRNLEDKGVSESEAAYLLQNDIREITAELRKRCPVYFELLANQEHTRAAVLVNMAFNMGVAGLLGFRKTIKLVGEGDYHAASVEMLNSRWAKQVGARATRLAKQMRTGKWV